VTSSKPDLAFTLETLEMQLHDAMKSFERVLRDMEELRLSVKRLESQVNSYSAHMNCPSCGVLYRGKPAEAGYHNCGTCGRKF